MTKNSSIVCCFIFDDYRECDDDEDAAGSASITDYFSGTLISTDFQYLASFLSY
jgi:hypothetical protein